MIQIGFSTQPKNILSKIVRFFTKSKASHSFIVFNTLGRRWILESGVKGIVILPFDQFKDKLIALVDMPVLTDDIISNVMDQYLGRDYDFTGLFGMIAVYIGRWFKAKWHNPLNNPTAMFCSEFVVKTLQEAGYPEASTLDPADTSPQDLLDFLSK